MHSRTHFRSATRAAAACALLGLLALAGACAESTTAPERSPLAGLAQSVTEDSAGNPVTPPTGSPGSSWFSGTVRAPGTVTPGGDSLTNSPRIPGVVVRVYPVTSAAGASVEVGPQVATATTDAQGEFTIPPISGGEYAVTFTPPTGSGYRATYALAEIHAESYLHHWWVTLQPG